MNQHVDNDMYEDDDDDDEDVVDDEEDEEGDSIEQLSDDEDDDAMVDGDQNALQHQQQQQQHQHQATNANIITASTDGGTNGNSKKDKKSQTRRGNRLSDQMSDLDDEPVLDGYERTEVIGQGAYGIVFKGKKEDTGEIVAIKRIPFSDSTPEGGVPCNVIREISLLRELNHPNVVKLYDIIQKQPIGLFLVFEFVSYDLKTYMDQYQTSDDINDRVGLPLHSVKSFLRQILAGVSCCHTHRILHRDLKPHNLLISGDGKHVKLADFGLARLSAIPNGPYTFEVVTLWYRAPELLLGANRYSTAVDVWSIGCIFAEMASGMPLFPGRSDIDQLFKIFQRRGTPTSDLWPAVIRLPHYNAEFPQWRELPITDFVTLQSMGGPAGADLLNKLLQYDPDRRIACKTALQHPFFLS